MRSRGALAIILHTHMPYVEGFGTWPFGEEWLWEAIACSYLPLLEVLDRAPITLSLTPVLCDQLEAPGALERCIRFLEDIRPESHRLDIEARSAAGETAQAAELERSAAEYAAAAAQLRSLQSGDGLLAALGRHATWTSAATHPVLPLLASDAGISLQLQTGIASHRRRFGDWAGGFWLPECAHAPWLDPVLEEAGVRAACVELTGMLGFGDRRHLTPLVTEAGPILWPVDRAVMALVWSPDGYPASGAYRSYHARTEHDHRVARIDGGIYDAGAARELTRNHARDFVRRVSERASEGGVCVCAFDTELLGHWWYEGVWWLSAVLDEAERGGLELVGLDEALECAEPVRAASVVPQLCVTSWGEGGDLRTWSAPAVAEYVWRGRKAELSLQRAPAPPHERALRELLALQASDWAFLQTRGWVGDYARERMRGHTDAFERASAGELGPALRNLAPELVGWTA